MKNAILYGHGGSANHGCEALVRTTCAVLTDAGVNVTSVISRSPQEDEKYIKDIPVKFVNKGRSLNIIQRVFAKSYRMITGSLYLYDRVEMKALVCGVKNSICFSIGGDNYCYFNYDSFIRMNSLLLKNNNKTVLWGCSVSPELLEQPEVVNDMKRYSLITARESITYNALKNAGAENVVFCPDSAFLLEPEAVELPDFFNGNTVGINISPLILTYEKDGGMTEKNYERLVEYILNETDMNIALVPHVIKEKNDDNSTLRQLYEKNKASGRIYLVDENRDYNARQIKYVISKCRFLVTARTHASIAAYSTIVPTLVTGYSVKAEGIAQDIFGSAEHYVCAVQNLKTENDLLNDFIFVMQNENHIKECEKLYCENAGQYFENVKNIVSQL